MCRDPSNALPTAANNCQMFKALAFTNEYWSKLYTLVMTTISSRGSSSVLMALPRYTSESPFEYMFAVSNVFTPCSNLCNQHEITDRGEEKFDWASRKLDMLDGLFLTKDPRRPSRITIRHHPENYPGHFQP